MNQNSIVFSLFQRIPEALHWWSPYVTSILADGLMVVTEDYPVLKVATFPIVGTIGAISISALAPMMD